MPIAVLDGTSAGAGPENRALGVHPRCSPHLQPSSQFMCDRANPELRSNPDASALSKKITDSRGNLQSFMAHWPALQQAECYGAQFVCDFSL